MTTPWEMMAQIELERPRRARCHVCRRRRMCTGDPPVCRHDELLRPPSGFELFLLQDTVRIHAWPETPDCFRVCSPEDEAEGEYLTVPISTWLRYIVADRNYAEALGALRGSLRGGLG